MSMVNMYQASMSSDAGMRHLQMQEIHENKHMKRYSTSLITRQIKSKPNEISSHTH